MLETLVAGFSNISPLQLALVGIVALFAAVVGGMSGYGTGALMPLVLVPLVGAEPVVPIIAISAMLTNASRALAYVRHADRRRVLRRRAVKIGDTGLAAGSVGYGVLVGGTSGSGVILLSLLMAAGLEGAAVIATDATISLGTGLIKISVFGLAGAVTAQVLAFALLIGAIAIPGAFLAKAFVERMPVHIHTAILDAAVIVGGLVMITAAL